MAITITLYSEGNTSIEQDPTPCQNLSLVWIKETGCRIKIGGLEKSFAPNTLLCVSADAIAETKQILTNALIISFPEAIISTLQMDMLLSHRKDGILLLSPEGLFCNITGQISHLLGSILDEYNSEFENYKDEVLQALLRLVVLEMIRTRNDLLLQNPFSSEDLKLVSSFIEMVRENFMVQKKVSDYAFLLSISPNYLNIKVKKITGNTASYHIQQSILQAAIKKVTKEGLGLKQVAYFLGYDDITYFSKFFKKLTGHSFSKFRKDLSPLSSKIFHN